MCEEKIIKSDLKSKEKYFEVLEIDPGVPFLEVKSAYLHLKKLYSSQPLVLAPVLDEISEEKRLEILTRVEDAYDNLKELYMVEEKGKLKATKEWVSTHNVPEFEIYSGNALKITREVLGVELKEIALFTGIPVRHLKNIEMERFDLLPPKGYIKVFLKKYTEYLSLDSQKVIDDYLKVIDKQRKQKRVK